MNAQYRKQMQTLSKTNRLFFCHSMNTPNQDSFLKDSFILKRVDDNGNVFEVGTYKSKTEAEQRIHEFTLSQHKQHYWVEEIKQNQANIKKDDKASQK